MAWYNPSDPTQRNYMLAGLVGLVLIVPFNMYLLTPRKEANSVVADRIETLDEQNRAAGVILARGGGDLEERMALYERHVARLEELIPGQEEVAVLLDDIQALARNTGVAVIGLDPEPTQPAGPYNKTGYSMTVVGEYHDFGRFLTQIASLSRIVTPVQLDLELYQSAQTYPNLESPIQATFRIETYVLPDPASLPPAELPRG
jgi:type IV pilus assembly protein PilO